jgi:hypothetical protein
VKPVSRRGALLASVAAALASVPVAAKVPHRAGPSPDAELIRLCEELIRLDERYCEIVDAAAPSLTEADDDRVNALVQPITDSILTLKNKILPMRATTLAGVAARARAYHAACWDNIAGYYASIDEDAIAALVRDLIATPAS